MATAEQALKWVDRLHTVLRDRRNDVDTAYSYFGGEQPLVYATEEWKKFHKDRYVDFSDNWCGVVARSAVDRLRIDGFRLGGAVDVVTSDERELWNDWNRNEMTAQSNQGFLASSIAKRSAVLVWGNSDDEPNVTWEHPLQVAVAYADGTRERLAALKVWTDDDSEFATLYLPHEVWKFVRPRAMRITSGRTDGGLYVPASLGGGGWKPREIVNEMWPLPNPMGEVPIVEWLNRPLLGGLPISDIAGVMAMQDAINMLWGYMFAAADYASMPARVVLGAEPPKIPILNEAGQVIGSRPAKMEDLANGRLLFLPGAERIAQWESAKLDVFGTEIERCVGHVSSQTSTPGHYLKTNDKMANLNGDALTAAEVPLATKVENQQTHYNPAAKETARLMALARGKKDVAASIRQIDGRRFVHWKDAATHSLAQVADAATKDRAVGMSLRTVLERRYGMTESEIDREMDRIRAEQSDPFLVLDAVTQSAVKGAAGGDTNPGAGA